MWHKKGITAKKILTLPTEATIKAAAKNKIDFYSQNKYLNLIAHELHCHHLSYKSFTLDYRCKFWKSFFLVTCNTAFNWWNWVQEEGNYTAVQEYISEHVFIDKKAVSMIVLQSVHGLDRNDSPYRSKLKKETY